MPDKEAKEPWNKGKEIEEATQFQIMEWVNQIIDLLLEGKSNPEIYEVMRPITNRSDKTLQRYMQRAVSKLKEDHTRETSLKRTLHIEGLRTDLKEAYLQYNKDKSIAWHKQCMDIKKELKSFEPDNLQSKSEAESQTINITYSKVGGEDNV